MQKIFVEPNFQSKKYLIMLCGRKNVKKNFLLQRDLVSTLMGESGKNTSEMFIINAKNSYKDDHTKNFKSTEN